MGQGAKGKVRKRMAIGAHGACVARVRGARASIVSAAKQRRYVLCF